MERRGPTSVQPEAWPPTFTEPFGLGELSQQARRRAMTFKEIGTTKVPSSVDEIDWRHVWLANAVITSEPLLPREIPRYKSAPRHSSSSLRLHKLRRLRAALGPRT